MGTTDPVDPHRPPPRAAGRASPSACPAPPLPRPGGAIPLTPIPTPPPPAPAPDDAVVAAVIRAKARKLAARRLLPPGDADDIAQDLALDLLRRAGKFDPAKGDPIGFVWMVAERAAARLVRDRRAGKRDDRDVARLGPTDDVIDPRAEAAVRHVDLAVDSAAVLDRLPEELRAVARAIQAADSVAEAAKMLGIPRTTLVTRLRALHRPFAAAGFGTIFRDPSSPGGSTG